MSVYSMVMMGMAPFGGLMAGVTADRLGAPVTVAIGGAICLAAAGIFWTQLPQIRVLARRMVAAQQAAAAEEQLARD
jgi:hypothetical protein